MIIIENHVYEVKINFIEWNEPSDYDIIRKAKIRSSGALRKLTSFW